MQDLEQYLTDRLCIEHAYVAEWQSGKADMPDMAAYDAVFCLYHRWGIEPWLPWGKVIGALRAQWLIPERKRPPEAAEFAIVNRYCRYQVVTQKNFDEYTEACPGVVYLTNPVNTRRFVLPLEQTSRVVASWNGNARHATAVDVDVKGFSSIVRPACRIANVPLKFAEYTTCRLEPHQMPAFYRQSNVALCASLYEGASNSVMEAMAAGQAAIVTNVGNHREMQEEQLASCGDTGIIIVAERSIDAFVEALSSLTLARVLEMGEINRQSVERAWSWNVWADRYAQFLLLD